MNDVSELGSCRSPAEWVFQTPDLIWAYLDMDRDPRFRRLSEPLRLLALESATLTGATAARDRRSESGDPYRLAVSLGLRVSEVDDWRSQSGPATWRAATEGETGAEYLPEQSLVVLHRKHIQELSDLLGEASGRRVDIGELEETHLAHEIFHRLEDTVLGYTREKVEQVLLCRQEAATWRRPRFPAMRRRVPGLRRTGEVAAHAFVREFCETSFYPGLLDWLWAYRSNLNALRMKVSSVTLS